MHEEQRAISSGLVINTPDCQRRDQTRLKSKMKAVIAFLALSGAAAFAPAPAQRSATALNAQKPA